MIQEGDRVNVFFERVEAEYDAEVIGIPCATGDSWKLKRRDGNIVYVQNFSKMEMRS